MGGGTSVGCRTFALPPQGCHIVSPGEDCALPHIKTICGALVMKDTAYHLKVMVFRAPCGVGPVDQVGNHICGKVGMP